MALHVLSEPAHPVGVRYMTPNRVADDVARRPPGRLYFGDMVFGAHYERLLALADSFSERGVGGPFICESRADVLDDRRCDTLRKMGVIAVKVGVESSDAQHLSTMNKQLGRGGLERGLASLRRHDLKLILYLMLGGPGSSEASTRATFQWASAQQPDYVVMPNMVR